MRGKPGLRATAVLPALLLAACSQKLDGPDPSLAAQAVDPALVCVEEITTTITLSGEGLSPTVFDSLTGEEQVVLPKIDLQRTADLDGNAVSEDPIRVPDDEDGGLVRWVDDSRMEFDVTPELGLDPGVYDITVTNPDGSQSTITDAFGGVERPVIDEIVPAALCVAQGERSFEIHGSGFLLIDGARPMVTVGDQTYEADMLNDCSDLSVPLEGVQVCSTAAVTIPQDDLDVGDYDVVLTNPEPAECSSSDPVTLEITAPPDITSVEPLQICTGGGQLVIKGEGFNDRATVTIGDQPASGVEVVSDTEIDATFGALGLEPGTYPVTVEQDGCSDTFETDITVVDGIIAFFVDPPVVYSGIDTRVTVYVSGLDQEPVKVSLVDEGGQETDLSGSISFSDPGEVQVVVPNGLAAGSYDVLVDDGTECESILPGGLTVTDQDILALESIDPPFGYTGADTAVELRAAETPPSGEVQFARTPRAYLSPSAGGAVASEIQSVAFVSPTLLTGIVPEGLPVGTYDVIVVNPSGEVGVLEGAFEITADPPPAIDAVSPGSLATSNTPQPTTISGGYFRTPAVELTCRLADGVTLVTPTVTVQQVTGADADMQIDVTVDTSNLDSGTACVVRVTNDDGTYADFSSVTITNPAQAQNAIKFAAGPTLNTGRRAPAAAAGRASRAARFVYAIGGDDGSVSNPIATVEASSVDRFGDLAGWFTLPVELPAGRTFARAVAVRGRFIYLVGGNDGAGPLASALRAKILDPSERPERPEPALSLEDTGLDAGIWYYRLSAVVSQGATQDPGGGEILASDPLVIQIPELQTGDKVQVTLSWPAVPDAVEYRLYRTPMADMVSGDERLLTTVTAPTTSYTDDGGVTPAGDAPLPLGCTGAWETLGDLGAARQAHGLTLAPDPATADLFHIYAVAGEDGGGELESVERMSVTVDSATGDQTVTAWIPELALPAGTGRSRLEAAAAYAATASDFAPEVWLYALAGSAGAGTDSSTQAIEVTAGGVLTPITGQTDWLAVDAMSPVRTGYAAALANNFLYVLGGTGTEATGNKANLCGADGGAGCSGGPPNPPDLGGWTSLSDTMMQPRALMGKAIQSGFLYLIGGVDDTGAVLDTTDQSPLGGQP